MNLTTKLQNIKNVEINFFFVFKQFKVERKFLIVENSSLATKLQIKIWCLDY